MCMFLLNSYKKISGFISRLFKMGDINQNDKVEVNLPGLSILLKRESTLDVPHEITIVIPRAEFRKKCHKDKSLCEYEIIYNSITIVHSPQHPPIEPPSRLSK